MITQGHLSRHSQGRRGMADAALLDVVQDYALRLLSDHQVFDLGVVLKGGTALRKLIAGNAGRFSTDLDFAAPDRTTAQILLETLDGIEFADVRFRLENIEPLRARLLCDTPLGRPRIPARVEISLRPLWLPVERTTPVHLPVHEAYEFGLPEIPFPAPSEMVAEKLAAWRRRQKLRDLYDLEFLGRGALDEPVIRRLLVLKVWHDVVDDGLGSRPFDPSEIVADVDTRRLPSEDIGLLAQSFDIDDWLGRVQKRYQFVTRLDEVEQRVALCRSDDRHEVSKLVAALAVT